MTLVSMSPSPHLWVFACKTTTLGPELQVSMGPRHHPMVFCIQNNVTLAPELQDSMVPSPHLWILHAIQRLLDLIYKSLWVPDFTC